MKVILIPVADRPECDVALKQALLLADSFGGNIVGCHLRPPRPNEAAQNHAPRFSGYRKWAAIAREMPQTEAESRSEAAEALFTRHARDQDFELVDEPALGAGRTARWILTVSPLGRVFASMGPTADVSVISRPDPASEGPGSDFMLAALLETGRPVLVLPQAAIDSLGKRIVVAWNQSIEAARAVAAALPLLQLAESVHIVCAGAESSSGPSAAGLIDYLKCWRVNATSIRTRGRDASVEIFDVYRDQGADLLVMGAYSRGRLRETVFGGVTEDLLFGAELPVFALHS